MTVRVTDVAIYVEGLCPVEDAEPLLAAVQAHPGCPVDLSGCTQIHMAVVQILLATGVAFDGAEPPGFVGDWVVPLLRDAGIGAG